VKVWKPSVGTLAGFSVILSVMAFLIFAPNFLTQRKFLIESAPSEMTLPKEFLLATTFPVVNLQGKTATVGKEVSLRSYFSSPNDLLIVNFWATWCPPCVDELPSMEYLGRQLEYQKFEGGRVVRLVTISVDEGTPEIGNLFSTLDFKPTLTVLFDKSGSFSTQMGTVKFPETYLVNSEQKVLYKWLGPQDWLSSEVIAQIGHFSKLRVE
jgi:thiol-disulfide isomerase/thioredoxin